MEHKDCRCGFGSKLFVVFDLLIWVLVCDTTKHRCFLCRNTVPVPTPDMIETMTVFVLQSVNGQDCIINFLYKGKHKQRFVKIVLIVASRPTI
jgi:hypothetical protein